MSEVAGRESYQKVARPFPSNGLLRSARPDRQSRNQTRNATRIAGTLFTPGIVFTRIRGLRPAFRCLAKAQG